MAGPHLAVVDGASFVLPYDHGLIQGLAQQGWRVTLFASRTRYNQVFLDALSSTPGVQVAVYRISRTAAPRWQGAWEYLRLWRQVWRQRAEFDFVNLQFSILWPLELPFVLALRRRFVYTLHNVVPHGFQGRRHRPTAWLARAARRLVFVSDAVRDEFVRRYGGALAARATVLPHGSLPVEPGQPMLPYGAPTGPEALVFWGNVLPYKGVDLLLALARSPAFQATGLGLEVQGAFAPGLGGLREELRAAGVRVNDEFLEGDALRSLLARNVIFLLPYRKASQSGALYTLLHQGCRFICSDTGDLGTFMRRHGLRDLLLADRSPQAVLDCLLRLRSDGERLRAAFSAAQQASAWDCVLAGAAAAYGVG